MSGRTFFDTNILVYADDGSAGAKRLRAQELLGNALRRQTGVVSTQVLMEYYNVATRKLGLDRATAAQRTRDYATLHVVAVDAQLVLEAVGLHGRAMVSHWDALIVRAAAVAGCKVVYSEDLQGGAEFDGVRIVNPF
jgi:predicted nucleic acid-binding protein